MYTIRYKLSKEPTRTDYNHNGVETKQAMQWLMARPTSKSNRFCL